MVRNVEDCVNYQDPAGNCLDRIQDDRLVAILHLFRCALTFFGIYMASDLKLGKHVRGFLPLIRVSKLSLSDPRWPTGGHFE